MKSSSASSVFHVSAGVVFVTLSGVAAAQTALPPDYYPSSSPSAAPVNLPSGTESSYTKEAAATQLIATTSLQHVLSISNALSARSTMRLGPPPGTRTSDAGQRVGLAGGGAADKWNVWASLVGDKSEYTGANRFTTNATNTVFGLDYAISPVTTVGLSAAFDDANGVMGAANNYTTTGSTVAPYVAVQLSKDWSLDGTVGWGSTQLVDVRSVSKADRLFYGANLSYASWSGDWQIIGKGSFFHGEEKYANSTNKIDQWRLGAQVGYWMNGVMPYAGLAFSNDSLSSADATKGDPGTSAALWTLGVSFMSLKSGLTAGVSYNKESGRSDSNRSSLMANLNYRF